MWFRSGDLRSHSRTLIFCPWTTSGRPSQCGSEPRLAGTPLLCEWTSLLAAWHQEFRCISLHWRFHLVLCKIWNPTFSRKASPNHYLLWMLHCRHCEPSVLSHVSRSSNVIEVSTKLAKRTFIAEHDTRPLGSCPVHVLLTEMKSFRNLLWAKKWLSSSVSTSKVELIAKTTSNCSQARYFTHGYVLFYIRSTQKRLFLNCFEQWYVISAGCAPPSTRMLSAEHSSSFIEQFQCLANACLAATNSPGYCRIEYDRNMTYVRSKVRFANLVLISIAFEDLLTCDTSHGSQCRQWNIHKR